MNSLINKINVKRIFFSCILVALAIAMSVYAYNQYAFEQRFENPVAYCVNSDTIYVVEKEGNTVLALNYSQNKNSLILKEKIKIEEDDPNYYYMIRRLYPGPDGVVVKSWIYDHATKKFSGYRFRLYQSLNGVPQNILTIFLNDTKKFPDINYAFDREGNHYFVNNLNQHRNIWQIPPKKSIVIAGENLPKTIREMGEKNDIKTSWNGIYVGAEGQIYVTSVSTDRVVEYLPNGLKVRQIGEVGFTEGLLLAPMEVFVEPLEWGRPAYLTVSSTGNRSWVQFDRNGRPTASVSPLKAGYPFADIYVGQVYKLTDTHNICSFDLVNKSFLVHGPNFKAISTYEIRQARKVLLLLSIAVVLLLPVFFYKHLSSIMRRLRFPFLLKLLMISIPPIFICAIVVGYHVMDVFKEDLEAEVVLRSENLAQAIVNNISLADLEAIQMPEDRGSPAYERIYKTVSRIVDRKVDHTPKWIIHKIRERRYYFGINIWRGSIYEPFIVPYDRTMFFKVLLEGTPQHGRFRDEQGEWFSYLMPIRNKDGKIIYVLELFRPTEAIDRSKKEAEYWIKRIGGTTVMVAIVLIFIFSYFSIRPLKRLIEGTQVVKDGSFDYTIRVSSRDEMETLAEAFNVMVAHLKEYTNELARAIKARESVENKLEMAETIQNSLRNVIGGLLKGTKSDYSFDWLIPHMETEHYKKGDFLIHKGDRADKMYYIKKGALRLVELDRIVEKGTLIGETGILSPAKERTLSVVCEEDCELYTLEENKARELFYQDPSVIFQLIHLSIERSLENLTATIAEKERIETDLKIARDIQTSVLPRTFPAFPDREDFDIFACMEPAKEVGGDFYDFFLINEKKLCFIIGDVSGKGVPAALFMMITKILLKTVASMDIPPDEVLFRVNNIIASQNEHDMFVTILCAILDTETGELQIGNAGHNPPLIDRGDNEGFVFAELPESIVLGPMEDVKFSSIKMTLKPNNTIFFYTDGVTEAMNPQSAFFSEERLKTTLSSLKDRHIMEIVDGMMDEIKKYAQGAPQSDDITMVILKFQGSGN